MDDCKRSSSRCIFWVAVFFLCLNLMIFATSVHVFAQEYIEYQVKEGDCLWTIARQFQLSMQEVTEINDIEQEQILSPGASLKIPQNKILISDQNTNSQALVHTVQKGESLWDIAQQYRLSLDYISSFNNLKQPDSLYIGQEIKIPIDCSGKDEKIQEERQPDLSFETEHSNLQGMSISLNQEFRELVQEEMEYVVKPGENLWTIAQNYHISLKDISQINHLEDEEKLSIGQIIKIPLGGGLRDKKEEPIQNKEKLEFKWVEHIVEAGENISIIAQKYHVPTETICQLNQITQQEYVFPGQRLKIKEVNPVEGAVQSVAEKDQNHPNQQEDTASTGEECQPIYYTVRSGDTLWSIAQHFSVSMESIVAVNYLSNKDVLSVGQNLEIPALGGVGRDNNKIQTVIYKVVKGDTLWNIAQKFDVTMVDIININQLQNVTSLAIGQKLNIPATELAARQETKKAAVAQEEKPKDIIHYVQKGETLWEICRKYQVSMQSVTSANHISESSRIIIGQKLVIPNVRGSSLSSRSFIWPLNGLITSQFGIRTLGGRRDYHTGIDIDGPTGASIRAAESGKVSFSGNISGYGNVVIIDHAGGYSTVYAHNSSNLVKKGQNVSKGDIIARLGATGNATGSHLHFEIRESGKPANPLNYLP